MNNTGKSKYAHGYTLIELVVGIIAFSAVMAIVTDLLIPQASRSIDPIYQVRATELAQSLFNEMTGKLFDENSDRSGGRIRCNEDLDADDAVDNTAIGERVCTVPASLGPDAGEVSRDLYDDIDDYHGLLYTQGSDFRNSLGELLILNGQNLYEGFQLSVAVVYDVNQDGSEDAVSGNIKRIDVIVTTPNGDQLPFSAFKHNY